jgi:LPS-assembly protein
MPVKFLLLACLGLIDLSAQINPVKADLPAQDQIRMHYAASESDGPIRHLRGDAQIETTEMKISADEIDYNSDTNWAYARGHVRLEHFETGDKVNADHAEYNIRTDEGKFYTVNGTSPAKVMTSPGVLTTTNPFYFQAQWAERIRERFIMHHGFLTDCTLPKPWWVFQAPVFDVIPGNRAIARHAVFRLKKVPILYLPYFYRPLGRNPRQSGFLTPNFGHSSLYGYMYGGGYYWAVNRSYDMTGVVQYFTERGPAFTYDFRGKPNETTDFNFRLYSVIDRGVVLPGTGGNTGVPEQREQQGGTEFQVTGRTEVLGFTGRIDFNYLSSFLFRQAFSYSFSTAIWNEVYSIGYLQRRFDHDSMTLNIVAQRNQTFQAVTLLDATPNQVIIQKLPSLEFTTRDRNIVKGPVPLWLSLDSSAAIMNRQEPTGTVTLSSPTGTLGTGVVGRFDAEPRVVTNFRFAGFSLEPGASFRATDYTNNYSVNSTTYTDVASCGGYNACPPNPTNILALAATNLFRKSGDFTVDLRTPTIEKVFTPPKWLHLGTKLKHVIEGQATYEYVTGIDQYQRIIHFDETDILSNTNQLTLSMTNRLYRKDKNGNTNEILTWRVSHARYFDPTFGGAVVAGQRNVVLATEEFSPYTFLDGPRNYSPISSTLTISPFPILSFDWRSDYDPLRHKMIDQAVSVSVRHSKFFGSFTDTAITTDPLLVPQSNQISFSGGYGAANRKGWNAAISEQYDLLLGRSVLEFVQGSYNSNCCGFSVQVRHLNFGIRDENQYLFSFSVANLGTFGSLQKQARIF